MLSTHRLIYLGHVNLSCSACLQTILFNDKEFDRGGGENTCGGQGKKSVVYLLWTAFRPEEMPAHKVTMLVCRMCFSNPNPCCRILIIHTSKAQPRK